MKEITDYGKVFETLVEKTAKYLVDNDIKAQILGISGGIDSTVVAAICHEVSRRTNIPLIGRSIPTKFNKEGETSTADLVGKAFCNNYKVYNLNQMYLTYLSDIILSESGDVYYDVDYDGNIINIKDDFLPSIAKGNIQARLRMIYLYNLASMHRGIVMDTDNLTENNLGYFTIHGDVGDFNPIGGLWKTEVFKLAEWLFNKYKNNDHTYLTKAEAVWASLQLKPTAGLGITNNDLEEIGAESYDQVDDVLEVILAWKMITAPQKYSSNNFIMSDFMSELTHIPEEIIKNVTKRHFASEFKRKQLPIKITRDEIV
jgi:NAD+ synthetase